MANRQTIQQGRLYFRDHPGVFERALADTVSTCLEGKLTEGKASLRMLINSTIGFEALAPLVGKPAKSLHRMLSENGNPRLDSFIAIVDALQKETRVKLEVNVRQLD